MINEKPFEASNGMILNDAFWAKIKGREPTEEEYRAIREWKNEVNVAGLTMMYPPKQTTEKQ